MDEPLTRTAASSAVDGTSWRLVLGGLRRTVATSSLGDATALAGAVVDVLGPTECPHVRLDVRPDVLGLTVRSPGVGVTAADVEIARRLDDRLAGSDEAPSPPTRCLEVAIDAIDIPNVRRFWQAVLGYDESGDDELTDPRGQLPTFWFQQMDVPRTERNRIHVDLSVPHDQAEAIVAAGLAAGGTLVSAAAARAFWVLADPEGNEVCVCTWQDRDG
jgi:4a-hydroxytetrahydrobiopterin dehydratase